MTDAVAETIKLGPYTFEKVDHVFQGEHSTKWRFRIEGKPANSTIYAEPDLDFVMAEAIAERHMGQRGAGGTAVGTAADWFMRMIRQDHVDNAAKAKDVVRRLTIAERQWLRHVEKCGAEGVTDTATQRELGKAIWEQEQRLRAELEDLLSELTG